MPIYEQGYRRYRGTRIPQGRAWTVIAAAGLRTLVRKRGFLGLIALSLLPFLVRAVQIYASANLPQAAFLAPSPETFRDFLGQQEVFVFLMTVYVGSGLIASDRKANALQVYLSRPLTRIDYVGGKLLVLLVCLLLITWLPAVVLLIIQVIFAGTFEFVTNYLYLVPAITGATVLQAVVLSTSMLALSSLSNNSRYVGILFTVVMFFSHALYGVLYAVTRDSSWAWLSLPANLSQLTYLTFGSPLPYEAPWPVSVLAVAAITTLAVATLQRRVRAVELVA